MLGVNYDRVGRKVECVVRVGKWMFDLVVGMKLFSLRWWNEDRIGEWRVWIGYWWNEFWVCSVGFVDSVE